MIIGLIAIGLIVGIGTTTLAHRAGFDNDNINNYHRMQWGNHMDWREQPFHHMYENKVDFEEMKDHMKDVHPNWDNQMIEEMYRECHGTIQ